jgi:crossover junction endodeoxyribonuclease RusA
LIDFFVPGKAIPKQSFRYDGKGHGHTDPKVKAWQETVKMLVREAVQGEPWLTGDVEVALSFALPDKRRKDLDNLSKAVLDGMNGIAFADDKQVTRLVLEKHVDPDNPGVHVQVRERLSDGVIRT